VLYIASLKKQAFANKQLQKLIKNHNWLEADMLAMCKEKEQFEPRTSGLQDQRFLQLELESNNKLIYEKSFLPSHTKK